MTCLIRDIPVYYEEYGEGKPILCIHGSYVDHRMMAAALEPVFTRGHGYRRIYMDLPGMGKTPSAPWLKSSDNMLELLIEFINTVIGKEHFLLAGSSYGGYLSLGLIHEMNERIDGALLLCPMIDPREDEPENLPKRQIVNQPKQLDFMNESSSAYMDMAVVVTQKSYEKWQNCIQPAIDSADMEFLTNHLNMWYSSGFQAAIGNVNFDKPSCILTGRQDHLTGYKIAYELLERFPRATFAAMDCAGHFMERDTLVEQMVKDWIDRVELNFSEH